MINKPHFPIMFNNSNQIFLLKVHKNKNLTKEINRISHKEILHPAQSKGSIALMWKDKFCLEFKLMEIQIAN